LAGSTWAWSWRLCLGWLAISIFPVDGDIILKAAAIGCDYAKDRQAKVSEPVAIEAG